MSHAIFRLNSRLPHYIRFTLPVVAGLLLLLSPTLAQETPAPPASKPITNLKDGLEAMDWNTERRGPLLVLNAQETQAWMPEREPGDWYTPQFPPEPLKAVTSGRGLNVETVASYFGRKLIRAGSIAVFAPTEMVIFNTRLPRPDPYRGLRRNEKMALFQALLTEAQWQMLCSDRGLGLGDLVGEQRDLFLQILPNPMKVIQYKNHPTGGWQTVYPGLKEGEHPQRPIDPRITLSEAQRQAIRLRINRTVNMTIPSANSQNGGYGYGAWVNNQSTGDKPFFQLASGEEWGKPDAYGIKIREKVPSRLKVGHIDFDSPSLNPTIALADAKTVADIMKRIREATRLEIYADNRVMKLTVSGIGLEGAVRSGDVLKALAWAVTGAYRKVGPVFILTDDIAGIATRRSYISAWEGIGSTLKQKLIEKANKAIQAKKPIQYTAFAKDDPFALGDDMMKRIEAKWNTWNGRYQGERVRLADLPPAMQENARKSIAQHLENDKGGKRPILTDRVNVSVQVGLSILSPEIGTIRADNFGWYDGMNTMLPPATGMDEEMARKMPSTDPAIIPARMKAGGILYVAPKSKTDAVEAVEIAKLRGLKQLWLLLPMDGAEGKELLAAAIKAGKASGIPVYAALRLMVAPPVRTLPKEQPPADPNNPVGLNVTPAPADRDINVLGETLSMMMVRQALLIERWNAVLMQFMVQGDWMRPDAPLTMPTLKQRILSIAQTPGLAGIVLRDLLPMGYDQKETNEFIYFGPGMDFGYSEDHRVALIRQEYCDPVDLTGVGGTEVNLELPFFREEGRRWIEGPDGSMRPDTSAKTPYQAWGKLRYEIGMRTLTDLYKAIRKEIPATIPIIASQVGMNFGNGWFGTWDAPERVPMSLNGPTVYYGGEGPPVARKRPVESARESSKTVYTSIMYYPAMDYPGMENEPVKPGTPPYYARNINQILEEEAKQAMTWDGLVLDLTSFEMKDVRGMVLGSIAPPGTKPTLKRAAEAK